MKQSKDYVLEVIKGAGECLLDSEDSNLLVVKFVVNQNYVTHQLSYKRSDVHHAEIMSAWKAELKIACEGFLRFRDNDNNKGFRAFAIFVNEAYHLGLTD